ncbi:MAG: heparinase II/III domain-containing protein [Bacteroidales bacterium]
MKQLFVFIFIFSVGFISANEYKEARPKLFLTPTDIQRAKQQLSTDPVAKASYELILTNTSKELSRWRKTVPARGSRYTMDELFSMAATTKYSPAFDTEVVVYAIQPTDELAEQIREKMLYEIGLRKALGSWRNLGIHEAERLRRFLQNYDLMAETGVFSEAEKLVIKDEICKSARFLELWSLSYKNNLMNLRDNFCLNIKFYPACMIGVVAMLYPDVKEARGWYTMAQYDVESYFLSENFIDGGYGEGSVHYWHPTVDGLMHYLYALKNMGYGDYIKNPAFALALKRTITWRMNLTAPDGRKVIIGDGHRLGTGTDILEKAATLFNDCEFKWTAQTIQERVNGNLQFAPFDLLYLNNAIQPKQPTNLMSNYPFSGQAYFRSGWDKEDNMMMMKYGATFAGQRSNQREPVIPGHAHEDCMEIEMHFKGVPMFVDGGYRGVYGNFDTYGGFWKATISHSTVGLGNPYGYDRTDGKYAEHVKQHGKEFRYEVEQKNITPSNFRLTGFGDVGAVAVISAKAATYNDVEHQRNMVWMRNSSIAIVYDELTSKNEQNYEWYLNPIGKMLKQEGTYTFGDDVAKLDVVPVGNQLPTVKVITNKTENVPPYYFPFLAKNQEETVKKGWRWWDYSLMIQSQKAKDANYFNLLIPYKGTNPYSITNLGKEGKILKANGEEIVISSAKNSDKTIEMNGSFGVVTKQKEKLTTYAAFNSTMMKYKGELLLTTNRKDKESEVSYDPSVVGVVSLVDKRASFTFKPATWNVSLILVCPANLDYNMNQFVTVSFKVDTKPTKLVALKSSVEMPKLKDEFAESKIEASDVLNDKKNYSVIRSAVARTNPNFEYNETTKMLTITLTAGFNQLIWE